MIKLFQKILIKPQMGTRVHGSTTYEPLTTFLRERCDLCSKFCTFWFIFV